MEMARREMLVFTRKRRADGRGRTRASRAADKAKKKEKRSQPSAPRSSTTRSDTSRSTSMPPIGDVAQEDGYLSPGSDL
jgi:sRNA-binding protein